MAIIVDLTAVNYSKGRSKPIMGIVYHSMDGFYQGTIGWFRNPDSKASAHYLISAEGEIRQMVRDEDTAWQAGVFDPGKPPTWMLPNPNYTTLGIELEDKRQKAAWRYPQVQIDSCSWLTAHLCNKWNIPKDGSRLFNHKDLNPSRRSDPVGNWDLNWIIKGTGGGVTTDMVNKDLLNAFFIDLLGRSPDPGAISTYQDKPDWPAINVYHAIRTSAERQQYVDQKRIKLEVLENQLGNLDREVVALRVEVKTLKESVTGYEVVSDYNEEQMENQRKNILEQEKEIEVLNQRIKDMVIPEVSTPVKPPQGLPAMEIRATDAPLVKLLKRIYNFIVS